MFTLDELKQILVDRVGLPRELVPDDPHTTFGDIGLDSLAIVEVQLALAQKYDLIISDEDAQQIVTLGDAVRYVNARLQDDEVVLRGAR